AYITIKNRVHSARTPDEMMRMLKELGEEDPTYNTVYNRIMGNASSISEIKDKNRERLLAAFWKTFKAQNADVKIVYVLEDNVLEVGDSNLNTAARQISSEFTNGLVRNLKRGSGLFNYDEKSRQYKLVRDKSKKTI